MDQFCYVKVTFNFAHRPILHETPFTKSGHNSITNVKGLDIQDIIDTLSAKVRETKARKI